MDYPTRYGVNLDLDPDNLQFENPKTYVVIDGVASFRGRDGCLCHAELRVFEGEIVFIDAQNAHEVDDCMRNLDATDPQVRGPREAVCGLVDMALKAADMHDEIGHLIRD